MRWESVGRRMLYVPAAPQHSEADGSSTYSPTCLMSWRGWRNTPIPLRRWQESWKCNARPARRGRQARAGVIFCKVLRELADAVGTEDGDEVGGAAASGRDDGAVQPAAELLGELAPALQLAVVGVQGAAAA